MVSEQVFRKIYQKVYVNGKEIPLALYKVNGKYQRFLTPMAIDYIQGTRLNETTLVFEPKYRELYAQLMENQFTYLQRRPYDEDDLYYRFLLSNIKELSDGYPTMYVGEITKKQSEKLGVHPVTKGYANKFNRLSRTLVVTEEWYLWYLRTHPLGDYSKAVLDGTAESYFRAAAYPAAEVEGDQPPMDSWQGAIITKVPRKSRRKLESELGLSAVDLEWMEEQGFSQTSPSIEANPIIKFPYVMERVEV